MCRYMTQLMFGDRHYGVTTLLCSIRHSDLDGDLPSTSASASVVGAAGVVGAGARTGSAVQCSSTISSSTGMDSTDSGTPASTSHPGPTIRVIGSVSLIPTGNLRDATRRLQTLRERILVDLAPTILQIRLAAAGRRSKAAPGRVICQTRTVRLCRGTQATRKASEACPLEEKRHGAFRRLQVGPSFRKITPASVAVPC